MRDHHDLKALSTSQIFTALKAYEFEMEPRKEEDEPKTAVLVANEQPSTSSRSNSNPSDFLIDEQFVMLARKFKRFMRKNNIQGNPLTPSSSSKRHSQRSNTSKSNGNEGLQILCYNCR